MFAGDWPVCYALNLHSRIATRVLLRVAAKGYTKEEDIYRLALETAWPQWFLPTQTLRVDITAKFEGQTVLGRAQAVVRLAPLLNVFRYGILSFQYISHRVLRWTLAPLLLPLLLVANIALATRGGLLYPAILLAQAVFYAAAFTGYLLEQRKMKIKAFFVPYYFCVMNYSMYAGFMRLVRGRQSVLWERAKRA